MTTGWPNPHVQPLPLHRFNAHTQAHVFRPGAPGGTDPVLGVDLFHMPYPTFQPHPHAGLSAVTYLLPESPGSVRNRDSLGDDSRIGPGDLHWTQAGHGLVHEEWPAEPGVAAVGLQVFVNLPAAHRDSDPAVFKVAAADMPQWQGDGVQVRVVAGDWQGLASPIARASHWWTRLQVLDVTLAPGAIWSAPVPTGWHAVGLLVQGSLGPADAPSTQPVAQDWTAQGPAALCWGQNAPSHRVTEVLVAAGVSGARLVWLAGLARAEPTVWWGPFAGNDAAQVQRWARAHQEGRMGRLHPTPADGFAGRAGAQPAQA